MRCAARAWWPCSASLRYRQRTVLHHRTHSAVRLSRSGVARIFQLHSRAHDGRAEPGGRRPVGAGSAARPQRPVRRNRQCHGRGSDGRLWLLHIRALGVLRDRGTDDPGARRAFAPGKVREKSNAVGATGGKVARGTAAPAERPACRRGPAAAHIRGLRCPIHFRQCRHATAREQCHHQAAARTGELAHCRLHRPTPACNGVAFAEDRTTRAGAWP